MSVPSEGGAAAGSVTLHAEELSTNSEFLAIGLSGKGLANKVCTKGCSSGRKPTTSPPFAAVVFAQSPTPCELRSHEVALK